MGLFLLHRPGQLEGSEFRCFALVFPQPSLLLFAVDAEPLLIPGFPPPAGRTDGPDPPWGPPRAVGRGSPGRYLGDGGGRGNRRGRRATNPHFS